MTKRADNDDMQERKEVDEFDKEFMDINFHRVTTEPQTLKDKLFQ